MCGRSYLQRDGQSRGRNQYFWTSFPDHEEGGSGDIEEGGDGNSV